MLSLWSSLQAGQWPTLLPGLRDMFPHHLSVTSKRRPWLMSSTSTTPGTGSVFCTVHAFSESKMLLQSGQYLPTCLPRGPHQLLSGVLFSEKPKKASSQLLLHRGHHSLSLETPQAPDTLPAPSQPPPPVPPRHSSACRWPFSAVRKGHFGAISSTCKFWVKKGKTNAFSVTTPRDLKLRGEALVTQQDDTE